MSGHESPADTLKDMTEKFLDEFFVKGQELVRELIDENARLKAELKAVSAGGSGGVPTHLVERLVERVKALESEATEIRRLAGNVRGEDGDYRARLDALEREHYHLAAMYVAESQFHGAETLDDVVRTVTEILLNFVGVGAFTIYGLDEERGLLFPLSRVDGDLSKVQEVKLDGDDVLAVTASRRQPWSVGDPLGEGPDAVMTLPLVSGTRVVGIVRMESFLQQKREFLDTDLPLLALISGYAGTAIENAWIRAHAEETPMRRPAIEDLVGA